MSTHLFFAKATAAGLAALVTVGMMAGVDDLAVERHAATVMAKAASAAHTAALKPAAKRS